jgi:pimeloyl-ACP methyl ester carboxylesterase
VHTEDVSFASGDLRLGGTIALPDAFGRHPALVLIGGSGPSDRHNDGFFDVLRERLAGCGVATLTYDKRGVGASTGHWPGASVDELAADASAALATLRGHPRVAGSAVGVMGHSEGGWVALRLGARGSSPSHVILSSCPAVSFLDSEVFALTAAGLPPDSAVGAGALLRELARRAGAGGSLEEATGLIADAQRTRWFAPLETQGFVLDATAWAQMRAWGEYDPARDLSLLRAPTLVVLGADDPLTPIDASVTRYEQSARTAGRRQEIVVFPGADHRLKSLETADLARGYVERLSRWDPRTGAVARG